MSIKRTSARLLGGLLLAAAGTLGAVSVSGAQDTLKIAYIDPLSGPFANVGDLGLKHFQHIANHINAKGGVLGKQIEIVPFDSKGSPQESLVALRTIADQGIRYITQGNGSHIAAALIEGVEKNNLRNRGKEMLFLSYAAQNPELTNEKCSYWHFRFDDHAGMKLHGITEYMVSQPDIKKVFLLNQDYGFGHMVDSISKQMLAEKSTDIEVVGSIFHPIGKVKDFSPYIAQIRASGADSVITGNWGNDMTLLIKASASAGLNVKYFAFSVGALGAPTALGEAGESRVFQVNEWHPDLPIEENQPEMDQFAKAFKQQTKLEYFHLRSRTLVEMLVKAMEESNSTDPVDVARALENMRHETAFGTAIMRAEDHQLLQPQYIAKFTKEATNDLEDTGLGFVTVQRLPAEQLGLPTTCDMKRPR
jgi:branched-chain amino acid transport system substrate-binding protein